MSEETFTKIKSEILSRVRAICRTNINGKNSIKALNEYALSVINYYVGVVPIEPKQYKELDDEIRKVLIDNNLYYQPACKERLYLPRKELGRGLHNLVHKSERMQLDLLQNLEASKEVSLRRKAILQTIKDEKNFLSLVDIFLKEKYQLTGTLTNKILVEAQLASLYNELETKRNHKKLYEAKKIEQVDINGSSIWLHKGNVKARDESRLCYL